MADGDAQGIRQLAAQQGHQGGGGFVVKLVSGLVQKQHIGAGNQGAGDAEPLLFAARKQACPFAFAVQSGGGQWQPDLFQHGGELGIVGLRRVGITQAFAQAGIGQVGALRQKQAAAGVKDIAPLIIRPQSCKHAHQGGFADAAAPVKQQPFAALGLEVEVLQQDAPLRGGDADAFGADKVVGGCRLLLSGFGLFQAA